MAQRALDYITDDYSSHPTLLDTMPSAVTIEAWIYIEGGEDTYRNIVSKVNAVGDSIRLAVDTGNQIRLLTEGGGGGLKMAWSDPISLNTWYYVVGVYEAGQVLKVYVNAVVGGYQVSDTIGNGTADNFYIGIRDTVGNEPFNGIIDEVRISDIARTASEISDIWEAKREFVVDADTVALWHMNEGTAGTIFDETDNNYDCTITGASWVAGYNFLILFSQAVGSGAIAIAGSLGWIFKQAVGAGSVAIAGTLVWKFKQSVGAGSIAIASSLNRLIKISVGAGSITIIGALTTTKRFVQAVGEGSIAIAGSLNRKIKIAVGEGAVAISGTLSTIRKIFQSVGGGSITISGVLSYTVKRLRTLVNFVGREMIGYKPDVGYPYTYPFYYDTEVKIRDLSDPEVLRNGK